MKLSIFCVALAFSLTSQAKTWYVDAANYGKSGLDGSSEKAYGTIQAAVNEGLATLAGFNIQAGFLIMIR